MSLPPPEISTVTMRRVWCDGATDIRTGKPYALNGPLLQLYVTANF